MSDFGHSPVLQIIFSTFLFCVFIIFFFFFFAILSIVYFAIYGRVNLIHSTPRLFLSFSLSVLSDSFVTPLDCSPPTSSVHGISQARLLEWVAIPYSPVTKTKTLHSTVYF